MNSKKGLFGIKVRDNMDSKKGIKQDYKKLSNRFYKRDKMD